MLANMKDTVMYVKIRSRATRWATAARTQG